MSVTDAATGTANLAKIRLLALALILCGCAPAQLQLLSSPLGATVYENETGKAFKTPVAVSYVLNEKDKDATGCYQVKGFSAVWPSSAWAYSPKLIRLCGPGPIWHYEFQRPANAPGLETDQYFQNQILADQQRRAELAKYLAASFLRGYLGGSSSDVYVPPPIETRNTLSPNRNAPATSPEPLLVQEPSNVPRIAPDGTYVPGGDRPINICPNGTYVAGRCTLAPNGTYVGQ